MKKRRHAWRERCIQPQWEVWIQRSLNFFSPVDFSENRIHDVWTIIYRIEFDKVYGSCLSTANYGVYFKPIGYICCHSYHCRDHKTISLIFRLGQRIVVRFVRCSMLFGFGFVTFQRETNYSGYLVYRD